MNYRIVGMTLIEAARVVVRRRSAVLMRALNDQVAGDAIKYDVRRWTEGDFEDEQDEGCLAPSPSSSRGWTLLDMQTANAVCTLYDAFIDVAREKYMRCPLQRAIEITWKAFK